MTPTADGRDHQHLGVDRGRRAGMAWWGSRHAATRRVRAARRTTNPRAARGPESQQSQACRDLARGPQDHSPADPARRALRLSEVGSTVPTSSSYTAVSRPQIVVGSTGSPQASPPSSTDPCTGTTQPAQTGHERHRTPATPRRPKGAGRMHCPFCRHSDSRVVDSRASDDGTTIRRRRQCPECGKRFTTAETVTLTVTKRNGVTEPFSRAKVAERRAQGVPGPAGERGRPRAAGPDGRGGGPRERVRRDRQPRRRPRDPRAAARPRRDRLPAVRERLPRVQRPRGLRGRDRAAARRTPARPSSPPTRSVT